ncbi:S-adenosyl-L-methionine-dependent methyltransferase [Corynespora cassiicola Philippines]|uniref:S-adenosyl-L-methionine-dependent methyltransferase n=1 Tax=Corynespora cassiicola Philippines TaxID=1448308 RepID=A0A2T2NNJ2_CORCC|nr:S-adenosyl-L-methionine-dependent methyltransferase [Corynespora cassiicola Philippines]
MIATNSQQNELLASLRELRALTTKLEAQLEGHTESETPLDDRKLDTLRNDFIENANKAILNLAHPLEYWANVRGACADTAAFRCASELDLFQHIPLDGTASSTSLANANGVEASVLTRVMRLLVARGCFQEVTAGVFAHTRFSAFVREHPHFASFTRTSLEVFGCSATSLPDALLAPAGPNGSKPSAFEIRFGEGCYAFWEKRPEKLARFQHGLHEPLLLGEIKEAYDWGSVGGTVVDVGGGEGQVARCLAERFGHLNFVVQDVFVKQDVVEQVANAGLADRLCFEVHDYFTPQKPVENGAFFLKHCLHNNGDADCVRILKAIVPALEKSGQGARLIIAENVLPEWDDSSLPRQQRIELLQDDISMLQLFNAKKRTAEQYRELLVQADPRLEIAGIHRPPRGQLCCLDVRMSA